MRGKARVIYTKNSLENQAGIQQILTPDVQIVKIGKAKIGRNSEKMGKNLQKCVLFEQKLKKIGTF